MVNYSEYSNEARYVIAAPPSKPLTPTKVYMKSNRTSLFIQWSESAATQTPIIGYTLYVSDETDEYRVIYSSSVNSLLREFELTGLTTGNLYKFKVSAINFNGNSVLSDALEVYACNFPG